MITKFEKISTDEEGKTETYMAEIDNKKTYTVRYHLTENSIDNIIKFIAETQKTLKL